MYVIERKFTATQLPHLTDVKMGSFTAISILLAFCTFLAGTVLRIAYQDDDDIFYKEQEKAHDCKRPRPPFGFGLRSPR